MAKCSKLLTKARQSASNLRFDEACQLAECYGFELARERGSHRIYKAPGVMALVNLQEVKGMAKAYQVGQLLALIEELESDKGR